MTLHELLKACYNKDDVFVRMFCPNEFNSMTEFYRCYLDEICRPKMSRIHLWDEECKFELDVNKWDEPVLKLYYLRRFKYEN